MDHNTALPPERIETPRLILRRPTPADAEAVFTGWARDADVTRFLTWKPHQSIDDAHGHLVRCEIGWQKGSPLVWFLEHRETSRVIGSVAARPRSHGVNIGYVLARPFWGRGLMVEAVEHLSAWWLAQPGVHRVWATCDTENRQSARVLEKAGFALEGILRRWEVHPNISPEPRDALCFSKVR